MRHGVVNFLKPPGMTSHDAVSFVRRVANNKRVGHTGTLDPAAAGVLAICVGQATRLVEYLQAGRKTYLAEITFGTETDTHDAIGNVVSEGDASHVNLETLRRVLDQFRGRIQQTPPIFSAIKIDGQKLYDLARAGVEESEIEIAAREVEIHALVVTRFLSSTRSDQKPRAMLRIECGSGTYIRSLVRDIGRALGCGATMTFLVRTQNGAFDIDEAWTPEQIESDFASALLPMKQVFAPFTCAIVENDQFVEKLSKGQNAQANSIEEVRSVLFQKQPYLLQQFEKQADVYLIPRLAWRRPATTKVAFHNSDATIFVLADSAGLLYKPEKVFYLDRD